MKAISMAAAAALAVTLCTCVTAQNADRKPGDDAFLLPLPTSIPAMRAQSMGRRFDPSTSGVVNANARVPKPKIITKAEWGGKPSSGTLRAHFPSRLTLHHGGDAKPLAASDDSKKLVAGLQNFSLVTKGWVDIPYHFMIDLDGRIYEARDPLASGDTNTTYDPTGHLLIEVMGNYELQAPNRKQLDAICDMMAWACDYYNIDPATIRGHKDYAQTQCPGKSLYPYITSGAIEAGVRERIRNAYSTPKE